MRWMREPLVHFLLLGAALFGLHAVLGQGRDTELQREVVITSQDVAWLRENWERQRNRPPTDGELRGLVDEFLREEILYREAMALGLDQDDTIVRRRMTQKMDFLFTDLSELLEPSEAELLAFFQANEDRYAEPSQVSFAQVYFNPDLRGEQAELDARALLAELRASESQDVLSQRGDRFMMPQDYTAQTERDVRAYFGDDFARKVFALAPGKWEGPVASGYGLHLVLVRHRQATRPVEFAEVRELVLRDFGMERRAQGKERYYKQIRSKYEVRIERPVIVGENAS